MSDVNNVLKAINDAVEKRLFTADGLTAAVELRKRAAELGEELAKAKEFGERMQHERGNLQNTLGEATKEVAAWKSREAALQAREAKVHELEAKAAVEAARSDAYKDAFHIVFRNPVMIETVTRNGSSYSPGGSNGINETATTTRTTG